MWNLQHPRLPSGSVCSEQLLFFSPLDQINVHSTILAFLRVESCLEILPLKEKKKVTGPHLIGLSPLKKVILKSETHLMWSSPAASHTNSRVSPVLPVTGPAWATSNFGGAEKKCQKVHQQLRERISLILAERKKCWRRRRFSKEIKRFKKIPVKFSV